MAKRIARLPVVASAWRSGRLSEGQVRVIVTHVVERHADLFAQHEAELVPLLVGLPVAETNRAMAEWRARADALVEQPLENDDGPGSLHHSPTLDQRFVTNGSFEAEGGAVIATALAIADSGDTEVAAPRRRAEALVDVCQFFLDHHHQSPGVRHRPHLNLVIDAHDLEAGRDSQAELVEFGFRLDAAATSRLLCDCSINRVVAEKVAASTSVILDYGTTTRQISPPLWSALVVRDVHCRFPGCDRPASWCDGHHVRWFRHGGPTRLDNLVLLCRRHHRLLHSNAGYEAKLLPDATFEVTLPFGATRTSRPPNRGSPHAVERPAALTYARR